MNRESLRRSAVVASRIVEALTPRRLNEDGTLRPVYINACILEVKLLIRLREAQS